MKLKLPIKKKPAPVVVKSTRGRPRCLEEGAGGGKRANIYPGDDLRREVKETQKRLTSSGISKPKLSLSYVLRTGGWMLLDSINADLDKAAKGELHAKRRVVKTLRPETK